MLYQIYAMAVKELKSLLRDGPVLGVLFILPLVFVVIMTWAGVGNQTLRDAHILVVNNDRGPLAAEVIDRLRQEKGLVVEDKIDGAPATEERAVPLATKTGAQFVLVLVFPADFSEHLRRPGPGAPARIKFIKDPTNGGQNLNPIERLIKIQVMASAAAHATGAEARRLLDAIARETGGEAREPLQSAAQRFATAMTEAEGRIQPPVEFERQAPTGLVLVRPLRPAEQNVPSYTIFGIFFIVQIIGGTLLREKEFGTFSRLIAAPISRPVLLIGKLVPFYLVTLIQLFFMFTIGHFGFGLGFGESPAGLFAIAFATAAVANALGLFVAAVSRTQEQMGPLSGIMLVGLAAVGGIFIPYYEMPRLLQKICFLSPHAWALKGFQDVLVRGCHLAVALPTAGILLAFAAAFYLLALLRFRFL